MNPNWLSIMQKEFDCEVIGNEYQNLPKNRQNTKFIETI